MASITPVNSGSQSCKGVFYNLSVATQQCLLYWQKTSRERTLNPKSLSDPTTHSSSQSAPTLQISNCRYKSEGLGF